MKDNKMSIRQSVNVMPHAVLAQRMSLMVQQWSTAGLNAFACSTAELNVPAVVILEAREAPFELEWKLSPAQARALSAKLLEAAATCNRLDSVTGTGLRD